jgi:hypothetical protein
MTIHLKKPSEISNNLGFEGGDKTPIKNWRGQDFPLGAGEPGRKDSFS